MKSALCLFGLAAFWVVGCNSGDHHLAQCPSSCPVGQACINGACAPGCASSADCPSNEVCGAGACFPKACTTTTDCGEPGLTCVSNVCSHPTPDAGRDAGRPADAGTVDAGPGTTDAGAADAGGTSDAGQGATDAGPGSDAGTAVCPPSATLVYVIDSDGTLSSFTPGPNPTFTDLGKLNCPAQSGFTPYSMSVDRNPVAWVLYSSDGASSSQMFKVDIPTLTCTPTSFQSGQQNFTQFGMGFVADGPTANHDTLYIASALNSLGNGELGSLDTNSLAVSSLGMLNGAPELTGTGDGRLFAYFPGNADPTNQIPPSIVQLDKTNGNEGNGWPFLTLEDSPCQDPSGTCGPLDYAFAFWGGDFWIFLKLTNDDSTRVWQFDPSTQSLTNVLDNTGRHIVGAGVSTCAPVVPQ